MHTDRYATRTRCRCARCGLALGMAKLMKQSERVERLPRAPSREQKNPAPRVTTPQAPAPLTAPPPLLMLLALTLLALTLLALTLLALTLLALTLLALTLLRRGWAVGLVAGQAAAVAAVRRCSCMQTLL